MNNNPEGKYLSGAEILIECLKKSEVTDVFGYPGGAVLDLYDELYKCSSIKHYLVRHEQAAIHAAEGYARVTGKPGVAIVTSGPGACNAVTGIANAYYDGYPLVVFTGQVNSGLIGNDAFQEADIVGITRSCCKYNYLVKDVKDLPRIVKEAFYIANSGKKGPVVIDLPKDILRANAVFDWPEKIFLPGYNPVYEGHSKQIKKAVSLLCTAKKPVIIAGGGVVHSGAEKELLKTAEFLNIPVATTLMGKGTFPENHPLYTGMTGMHGSYCSNISVSDSDVLFALGTRFNDRITGALKKFAPHAKIIHVDIDPCSVSKNVRVDVPIVGDIKNVLTAMIEELEKINSETEVKDKSEWIKKVNERKEVKAPAGVNTEVLSPSFVIKRIYEVTEVLKPIITTDVGQHQMWAAQNFKFDEPGRFLTSGGLGTMGFGLPAAIGAAVARKDKTVISISGDGSVQMNIQELATCVQYNIPVIVAIINNGWLGMVRQWQEKLYNKHFSQTEIYSPDFVKLAQAYGAIGFRVETERDIEPVLKEAVAARRPVLIDFPVNHEEAVYPWVLAGEPISNVLLSGES